MTYRPSASMTLWRQLQSRVCLRVCRLHQLVVMADGPSNRSSLHSYITVVTARSFPWLRGYFVGISGDDRPYWFDMDSKTSGDSDCRVQHLGECGKRSRLELACARWLLQRARLENTVSSGKMWLIWIYRFRQMEEMWQSAEWTLNTQCCASLQVLLIH